MYVPQSTAPKKIIVVKEQAEVIVLNGISEPVHFHTSREEMPVIGSDNPHLAFLVNVR